MLQCRDRIWLENFRELFCNINIIPFDNMSLEQQLNAVTRLVILIFLVIFLLFDFRYALLFFVLSLLFIIILYYIQRKNMKENYRIFSNCGDKYDQSECLYTPPETITTDCSSKSILTPNKNYVSRNQKLAGTPNPKTLIPPIVAPRSHDFNTQRATNNTQYSHINSKSQFDNYRSGYMTTPLSNCTSEEYTIKPSINTSQKTECEYNPHSQCGEPYPYIKGESLCGVEGHINNECGCTMQNNNMPVNRPSGVCQQDPVFNSYNKNLNAQYLQPNVYEYNEVNEPINSNIGISFQQQFNPTTVKHTENGQTVYTEHASSIIEPVTHIDSTDVANVYDPRHTGPGDSTRAYTNEMLGQTRFFYDDIDAMKLPNYIGRSRIDHLPEADTYGPLTDTNRDGNVNTQDMREIVHNHYLENQLSFRDDLMQKLMKKSNARRAQQKLMPIRTY